MKSPKPNKGNSLATGSGKLFRPSPESESIVAHDILPVLNQQQEIP